MFVVGLLLPLVLSAQEMSGTVTSTQQEPLAGASVHWLGTSVGGYTNNDGGFVLPAASITDKRLVASFVGYQPDTIDVSDKSFVAIRLNEIRILDEITITDDRPGVIISDITPIKTEQITSIELKKGACCDLAGCFETQTTVQPQTTNVITNSKELRILGLSGVYNQVLIDGLPMIQGLTYTYGISSVPGPLVENIYVSKGANSVLQGFESISGQINVETKEPDNTDRLMFNAYMNSFLEKQLNVHYAFKKGNWSNLTAIHTTQPSSKIDRDNDNFLDLPLLRRYTIFNKWKYGNEQKWGWNSRIGIRLLNESRIGGQRAFSPEADQGSAEVYGQTVHMTQPEIWTKTGYRFNDQHNVSLYASAFRQNQDSYFGTLAYAALQRNLYANVQYELSYGDHSLKAGTSFRHLNLQEDITFTDSTLSRDYDGEYDRLENIAGFFAENTMQLLDGTLTWIAGIRADHHNQVGWKITPRTLVKFNLSPSTTVRANVGTGWRTANVFSENIILLVSSRNVVFRESLEPEQAINYGMNFTHKLETNTGTLSGYISADFYRTSFQNQIFPDYDTDPSLAIIENFTGTSISNGFQAEVFFKLWKSIEIKTGYNFLDVYRNIEGEKQLLPFNPRHKVIATFGYKPTRDKFRVDMNVHWHGEQRLPNTQSNPEAFRRPDFSKPYTIVNGQVTYTFKLVEIYTGCENIFDFRQLRPIISWQTPFSPYFDTSSVWGPTRGREFYTGVRFLLQS